MTNYDRLMALTKEEAAWFLMTYTGPCRCCIYKHLKDDGFFDSSDKCDRPEKHEDSCIDAYCKWLDRESTKDDDFMFRVCTHNIVVSEWNAHMDEFWDQGLRLVRKDGLVVGMEHFDPNQEEPPF